MDPLSIIASVAGVSTAGVSLVTVLFETLDTYRNAPKEIGTIARGIQDLSFVLDQLVEVLSNDREIHTRLLRKSVFSAVKQIGDVHEDVWDLIERGESGFGRVKWTFRKSKIRDLVARIEAHKSTIQLVCTTLLLAVQQRRVAKSKERDVALFARRRLRRQAENLVNAAHQSLLDLTQGGRNYEEDDENRLLAAEPPMSEQQPTRPAGISSAAASSPVTTPNIRLSHGDPGATNAAEGWELDASPRRDPETAALFLYNVVFSRTAERSARQTNAVPDGSNALIIHNPCGADVVIASRPFTAEVVDNLLHDWTCLTDGEIEEAAERASRDPHPRNQQQQPRLRSPMRSPTSNANKASDTSYHTVERQRSQTRDDRRSDPLRQRQQQQPSPVRNSKSNPQGESDEERRAEKLTGGRRREDNGRSEPRRRWADVKPGIAGDAFGKSHRARSQAHSSTNSRQRQDDEPLDGRASVVDYLSVTAARTPFWRPKLKKSAHITASPPASRSGGREEQTNANSDYIDPLGKQFQRTFIGGRQRTPYSSHGGEKTNAWDGTTNVKRGRSVRDNLRNGYDSGTGSQLPSPPSRPRSTNVPDEAN